YHVTNSHVSNSHISERERRESMTEGAGSQSGGGSCSGTGASEAGANADMSGKTERHSHDSIIAAPEDDIMHEIQRHLQQRALKGLAPLASGMEPDLEPPIKSKHLGVLPPSPRHITKLSGGSSAGPASSITSIALGQSDGSPSASIAATEGFLHVRRMRHNSSSGSAGSSSVGETMGE
ncbi:unnamed protein product, partial [Chrysoparadoxa australica]